MSYQDEFQAVVRAAAREVSLRSQAAYWLLAEKNKDLVSILADMRQLTRERWIREQVLRSYEEAKWYIGYIEPRIQYAEDRLREAVEIKDRRRRDQYKDQLVELGESYLYWIALLTACRDIFDAVWKLGTTLAVPDFDEPQDEDLGPGDFMTILRSRGAALHRGAKAASGKMEQQRIDELGGQPTVSEAHPVPRLRDSRVRPLDEVLEADRRRKEIDDTGQGNELRIRGIGVRRTKEKEEDEDDVEDE